MPPKTLKNQSNQSKGNAILMVFFLVALAYLAWIVYAALRSRKKDALEHFTDSDKTVQSSDSPDPALTGYESRMTVMKVFDNLLHRKPEIAEIEKYADITNEQDMLVTVIADYDITPAETFVASDKAAAVAASSDAGTTATATVAANDASASTNADSGSTSASASMLDIKSIEKKLDAIIEEANGVRAMLIAKSLCPA
jgi:hypothetical protein